MKDKLDEKSWTIKGMKVTMHSLKNDDDGKVPTLKKDMVAHYYWIKGRKENVLIEYNGYTSNEINGWFLELGSSSGVKRLGIWWLLRYSSTYVDH